MVSAESDACLETSFLRRLDPQNQLSRWRWLRNAVSLGWGSASGGRPPFFPTVLDGFTIHGPNGNHRCLVTEVVGSSLRNLVGGDYEFYPFSLAVAKKMLFSWHMLFQNSMSMASFMAVRCNSLFVRPVHSCSHLQTSTQTTFCFSSGGWNPEQPTTSATISASFRRYPPPVFRSHYHPTRMYPNMSSAPRIPPIWCLFASNLPLSR